VVTKVGVPRLAAVVRRHPFGAFLFFTFAYSWGYWIPVALAGGKLSHFPGLIGPMLAAFTVAAVSDGVAGPRDLLARMVRWRVPARWYAAAAVPGVAGLLGLGALSVTGRELPSVAELSTMAGLPSVGWLGVLALVFVVNGYGEEVGWRGHAWPRLRERHGMAGAALILAVFWAVWHVPTFWIDSGLRDFDPLLIPGWLIGLAAGAVVLGWLYERACASLLIVALFHALLNMASATPATEGFPAIFVTFVVIAWAAKILHDEGCSPRHEGRARHPGMISAARDRTGGGR
jgi:membrane protease YdiL (CAAX protease family)